MTAKSSKAYGGEDMVHYFTLLLTNQITILLMSRGSFNKNLDTPLGKKQEEMRNQANQIMVRLEERQFFAYPGGGDVYADYKTLRNKAFPGKAALPGWIDQKQFSLDDSFEKIYESCKLVVEQWWSE